MEEGLGFQDYVNQTLNLKKEDTIRYSSLALAYIGDCVFDLIIKSMVINQGNRPINQMHIATSSYVQASTQSLMMRGIQEHLTETELGYYRRGRNAKSLSPAKNQSITDYRRATGFESLLGYLYLENQYQRLMDLVKIGLESLETTANDADNDD